jgi:hypothetical protein
MENVGTFNGHFEGITAILWPFGNLEAIWCIFPGFCIFLYHEKSGNPGLMKSYSMPL